MRGRFIGLFGLLVFLVACQGGGPPPGDTDRPRVYEVVGVPDPDRLLALAEALGLKGVAVDADGGLRYDDPRGVLRLPTQPLGQQPNPEDGGDATLERFDFDALGARQAIDEKTARERFMTALTQSGLAPEGEALAGEVRFLAADLQGTTRAEAVLGVEVSFQLALDGLPLVGPGAQVQALFETETVPTQLLYLFREVKPGPRVALLSREEAALRARGLLGLPRGLDLGKLSEPELVYYAPPLSRTGVRRIYPHYLYALVEEVAGEEVPRRRVLVPAFEGSPKVTIEHRVEAGKIVAVARVQGGTPPYRYLWTSSNGALSEEQAGKGPELIYSVEQLDGPEVLSVWVEDAEGLSAGDSVLIELSGDGAKPLVGGVVDAGSEWIGSCAGLPRAAANARGFVVTMRLAGAQIRFNYGESAAWERDFKDTGDAGVVDNADLVFYTGHANAHGFEFCSQQDDRFLRYDETRWGDGDLEWLVIAACGPLQRSAPGGAWWERWGPAFQGLHLLLGYATVTFDNTEEGLIFATVATGFPFPSLARTMREAWVRAAKETQGPEEIWSVMGVYGKNGETNYNDYFHGRGPVGPDIKGSDLGGWWIVWGPS